MLKVKLFLKDQQIGELELGNAQEYIAGRSSKCDLVMKEGLKISRRHIHFFREKDRWVARNVSRYGLMFQENGKSISYLPLKDGVSLTVPPYEIRIEESQKIRSVNKVKSSQDDEEENTWLGSFHMEASLKVLTSQGREKVFHLNKEVISAGKDSDCDLILSEPEVEGRHLEIHKRNSRFWLQPMASVQLNGEELDLEKTYELQSGDCITFGSLCLFFQEMSKDLEKKISHLPVVASPQTSMVGMNKSPVVISKPPLPLRKRPLFQKIAGLSLVLILMFLFIPSSPKKEVEKKADNPYDILTEEQRIQLKHAFDLARRQFNQRRYGLCLDELKKIHDFLPSYKTSKELQEHCKNGLQALQREEDENRRERER